MANHYSFNPENHCELSYELLYLLKWLMDNEEVTFKKIIDRAVHQGFMQKNNITDTMSSDDIHHSIVNFLDMLDILLHESFNEHNIKKAHQINLMPSINKIDSYVCDKDTVQGSLDKTTTHLEHNPEINAKELLFKEILKRWKPATKKHHLN